MIHEVLEVNVPYEKAGIEKHSHIATITTYVALSYKTTPFVTRPFCERKRRAIILCPGGSYVEVSPREAEPIARQFLSMGFQAFVLDYSTTPDVWPTAILELAQAVHMVRTHAEEWNIDAEHIVVCGFSAGGHLAASFGCFWNQPFVYEPLGLTPEDIRPNGNILSYPVITSGPFAHRGSFEYLLKNQVTDAWLKTYVPDYAAATMLEFLSLENQVGSQNPPTFLWHTDDDKLVPVENALLYAMALKKANISLEIHIFKRGPHGISLATEEVAEFPEQIVPAVQKWVELAAMWMKDMP